MAKILLRINDEDKEALEILAKKNKRSLNNEILVAIDEHIETDENYSVIKKDGGKVNGV